MTSMPYSVGKLLDDAIARVRRGHLLRGIAIVGIVWLALVVTVMTVDARTLILDDRIRWLMTALVWMIAFVVAGFVIVRPLRRKLDLRRMARAIDARHPEHEERLSTLVELSSRDAKKAGFSAGLFALVCDLAANDAAKLDVRREFSLKRPLRYLTVLGVLALVMLIASLVSIGFIGKLFVRAVAPWADVGNVYANSIDVKPGDMVVLSGTVVKITANPVSEPFIRISRRRGLGWTTETSEPMAKGVYETTVDMSESEWRYRIVDGPAVTRYYRVRVSEMPKYDSFTARVEYPEYTGMKTLVISNDDVGAIKAIAGSKVKFDIRVPEGTLSDFRIGGEPVFEYQMVSNRTGEWSLDLLNRDGFRAEKGRHPLTSYIDQPPSVVIEKPTGTLRLPPHAKIPVELTASDDVAITSVYFRVSIDNEPWARHYGTRVELPPDGRFLRTTADVDLSLYDLVFANNIRFDVVVDDACPPEFGGPHSATSMPFTVQFAANEQSYGMQELRQEVADARRDIDEARRRMNDAQNLARQVRDELRRDHKVGESTEQKNERLAHELDEARKRIEELREEFADDERFAPLTKPLDRMLEESVQPALEQIENSQFRDREERAEEVDAAIPKMAESVDELNELNKRLNERAERLDTFEKLKDLYDRQEALARAARELLEERPTDTRKLEAWKRLQEDAMRRADELIRKLPEDRELREARRKMETAAREMDDLRRQAEIANNKNLKDDQKAKRLEDEKKRVDNARKSAYEQAAQRQKQAEQALRSKNLNHARELQRQVEDLLERAQTGDQTRQLQQLASEAVQEAIASKDDKSNERLVDLQRRASAALNREMKDGDKADMSDLLPKAESPAQFIAQAKAALEKADMKSFEDFADRAFEAARRQARAELADPDRENGEELRDLANEMDAMSKREDSAEEAEAKIAKLQTEARDALKRNDYWRAKMNQQEIATRQRRATEDPQQGGAAEAARGEANASQSSATDARQKSENDRNNRELKDAAIAAQQAAIDKEAAAQAELRAERAQAKLSAAEREMSLAADSPDTPDTPAAETPDSSDSPDRSGGASPPTPQPPTPRSGGAPAAESLRHELDAQAAELGMSKPSDSNAEPTDSKSAGGGVNDEVKKIAAELKRDDDPGFFRKLFSRFGWFKVQGASRQGLGERELREVPAEYRDLVRRYFMRVVDENQKNEKR